MSIFSLLRSLPPHSFNRVRGFTLIELLISLAIISIISAIVLVRFNSFDSGVLLKNTAHEVAMSIRQAQIYSVSVVNTNTGGVANYRYPFGVTFSSGESTYTFFRFTHETISPYYDIAETSPEAEMVNVFTMPKNIKISAVCVKVSGQTDPVCESSSSGRLDISFRRPEFSALFNIKGIGALADGNPGIEWANVKLQSVNNSTVTWVVNIGLLGQISVYKDI